MANYDALKTVIRNVVYENGNNEITGQGLQDILEAIVNSLGAGYQFASVATTETEPGTPDSNVMYIAGAGTYPNFGATVVPRGSLGVFRYNGEWIYSVIDVASWTEASNKLYYNTQAGNVAAKTIQADGFTLQPGGWLKIHFDNANTVDNPTLNVNNTGAHPMTFNGSPVSATYSWKIGETVAFYYDNYGVGIWRGIRLVDIPDFLNVNDLIGRDTPFASTSAARSAIPQQNRKAGLNITYLLSTGEDTSQWVQEQFIGDNVTDWSVADDWKPNVTVKQNEQTGAEILSGGFPVISIDNEPTAESENLVRSGGVASIYGIYDYNSEWIKIIIDSDNHILAGIKADGSIEWSLGVPTPVKDYIDEMISSVSPENYEQVLTLLDGLLGSDVTLKDMIEPLTDTMFYKEDSEKVSAIIDSETKLVSYRDKSGVLHELAGINSPTIDNINSRIEQMANSKGKYDIVFAAFDSSEADKNSADFVCTETDAQEIIQSAIDNWYANNEFNEGHFFFCSGTYIMTHFIEPNPEDEDRNGTPYCIVMPRGKNGSYSGSTAHYPTFCHFEGSNEGFHKYGTVFKLSKDAWLTKADGTTEVLQDFTDDNTVYYPETEVSGVVYPARYLIDNKRYSVVRCVSDPVNAGGSMWCSYTMMLRNINFKVEGSASNRTLSRYPIVVIDGLYCSCFHLENIYVSASDMYSASNQGADNYNVGFTGIRCNQGQSTGTDQRMRCVKVGGFYHGIEFGSEHWAIEDLALIANHIGLAFGCYHDAWGAGHANVLSTLALERNYYPMYFYYNNRIDSQTWINGRNLYMIGLGTEFYKYSGSSEESDGCHVEALAATPIGFINWNGPNDKHLFDTESLSKLSHVKIEKNNISKNDWWVNLQNIVGEHQQIVYIRDKNCFAVWNNYNNTTVKGYWEKVVTSTIND